jgi:outer membrane protein TolC
MQPVRSIQLACAPLILALLAGPARGQPADPATAPTFDDEVLAALAPTAGGLTADQAAARAAAGNPSIEARRLEVDLSRANTAQTFVRYLPRVNVAAGVTRTNDIDFDFGSGGFTVGALNAGPLTVGPCPAGAGDCVLDAAGQPVGAVAPEPFNIPRTNYKVELNLAVPFSDYLFSLPGARRAANADATAKQLGADAEQHRIELDARVAYYEWTRAVAQVALAERALASSTARLEDARLGLAGGTLAPADVLQIESAVASANVNVQNAHSYELVARQNLAVMMGDGGTDYRIGEDVLADVEPLASHGTLAELVAHGQKHRAEIRSLVQASTAADAARDSAGAELLPRLDGVANLTYANPNQQFFPPEREWNASWYIGLNLSWGLDTYFQARAQRRVLAVNRRMFDVQRQAVERGIAVEVTAAWQAWQRAAAALAQSEKALEAAQAAHVQRTELFRGGEATTTEVVEAELQWHNATMLLVNARIDLRIARARLLQAAALPLESPR